MPHDAPHIRIGDAVNVTHRLGMVLANGTVAAIWTEQRIIDHRLRDIPTATVVFPSGGKHDYPLAWLTRIVDNPPMDMPCPICGAENSLSLHIDVVLRSADGDEQLGSLICTECGTVAHPNIRIAIG